MFGSLAEKMKSSCWTNRSKLEKFLLVIMGFFSLVIIVLSSLVAAQYQQIHRQSATTSADNYSNRRHYVNDPLINLLRNNSPSLSTHVLDVGRGVPAANVEVTLYIVSQTNVFTRLVMKRTDEDGRIEDLLGTIPLKIGTYKLAFETGSYYDSLSQETFYPLIEIVFNVKDATQSYHVPITLSPFGYSTYRGS